MATQFVSPIGRLVQGSLSTARTTDDNGQPLLYKSGANIGQPRSEYYFALAVEKQNPEVEPLRQLLVNVAAAAFPAGEWKSGTFSWKMIDGDNGTDQNGKAWASKPGFKGCWVFKFSGSFPVQCWHNGQPKAPAEIKLGDYIRVFGNVESNNGGTGKGVSKNGLYLNYTAVQFEGFGEQISVGPDGREAFAAAPATYRPAGMSATPVGGPAPGGMPQPQPAPQGYPQPQAAPQGYAPPPVQAAPQPGPAAYVAPAPAPAPAPMPAAPQFQMTPSANGFTREQWHASGWTDQALLQAGYMIQVGAPATAPGGAPTPGTPAHTFAYGQAR